MTSVLLVLAAAITLAGAGLWAIAAALGQIATEIRRHRHSGAATRRRSDPQDVGYLHWGEAALGLRSEPVEGMAFHEVAERARAAAETEPKP